MPTKRVVSPEAGTTCRGWTGDLLTWLMLRWAVNTGLCVEWQGELDWDEDAQKIMYQVFYLKLCSHMRGAVAERRRVDLDIPAPPARVCSHMRGADTGGSAISWGQRWFGVCGFEADTENWVLDPFVAEQILLPPRDRVCVNVCNDLCWSQFSARLHSTHVWTYLKHLVAPVKHSFWEYLEDFSYCPMLIYCGL